MKKIILFIVLLSLTVISHSQCNDRSSYWFISTGLSKIKNGSAGVNGEIGVSPFFSSFAVSLKGNWWVEEITDPEQLVGVSYPRYSVSFLALKLYYCGGAYTDQKHKILIGAGAGVRTNGAIVKTADNITNDKTTKEFACEFSSAYLLRLSAPSDNGQGLHARLEISGIGSRQTIRPCISAGIFFIL